jgi:hypothetical protein
MRSALAVRPIPLASFLGNILFRYTNGLQNGCPPFAGRCDVRIGSKAALRVTIANFRLNLDNGHR